MNSINPEELSRMIDEGAVFLLDVRERFEREAFHIGGLHIPMQETFQADFEFPEDKPVVIYCEKGIRSGIAIQRLQSRYPSVKFLNLSGGMSGWKKAGLNSRLT